MKISLSPYGMSTALAGVRFGPDSTSKQIDKGGICTNSEDELRRVCSLDVLDHCARLTGAFDTLVKNNLSAIRGWKQHSVLMVNANMLAVTLPCWYQTSLLGQKYQRSASNSLKCVHEDKYNIMVEFLNICISSRSAQK